eukprot:TRINITY_DN1760_c0_g1_i7.p2 TRINITY_DN1760_c0_g1~~TRINITY_DN1760_c0_g1_i7.p2  ORF type:complete len:147 (+),score=20.82 TRINITY_DN1760_c0_g1_i7:62-442(+)
MCIRDRYIYTYPLSNSCISIHLMFVCTSKREREREREHHPCSITLSSSEKKDRFALLLAYIPLCFVFVYFVPSACLFALIVSCLHKLFGSRLHITIFVCICGRTSPRTQPPFNSALCAPSLCLSFN